jgi:NDP-sugar pyrophosphorylase family protein
MENSVRIFVLAGGKGERFFPFTSLIPKCLIPVAGRPCARWIVEDAMKQGFRDIVLCINKGDESNFKYEFRDLNLKYSVSKTPLGTVNEVLCARKFIDGTFILRYGDDLTDVDYSELVKFHRKKDASVTLGVTTEFRLPIGMVGMDKTGKVTTFVEKPKLERPSWVGVAVLEPEMLEYFKVGEDIAIHTLPEILKARELVYSFMMKNHWYDVGNLEHWRRADEHFRKQAASK